MRLPTTQACQPCRLGNSPVGRNYAGQHGPLFYMGNSGEICPVLSVWFAHAYCPNLSLSSPLSKSGMSAETELTKLSEGTFVSFVGSVLRPDSDFRIKSIAGPGLAPRRLDSFVQPFQGYKHVNGGFRAIFVQTGPAVPVHVARSEAVGYITILDASRQEPSSHSRGLRYSRIQSPGMGFEIPPPTDRLLQRCHAYRAYTAVQEM